MVRYWTLSLFIALSLGACSSDDGRAEVCPGGGDELVVADESVCVYDSRQSGIIETGFQCPPERSTRTDYGDLVVCTDGEPPPGIEDELEEEYPFANLADDPCVDVLCAAGETCVDGNCVDDDNSDNSNANANNSANACDPSPEICDDGEDNDCDGELDCEDPDCGADPVCDDPPACDDPFEPNDTIANASSDNFVGSKLCDADDVDFWEAPVTSGQQFEFIISLPQPMSMTVELLTADGDPVPSESGDPIVFDSTGNIGDGLFVGSAVLRRGVVGPFVLEITGDQATDYQLEMTGTDIATFAQAVKVGAGHNYSCALTMAGSIYCWGANDNLVLGDRQAPEFSTPLQLTTMVLADDLYVGSEHSCILTPAGVPYCWGENSSGELGVDTSGNPSGLLVTNDFADAESLALGKDFTCALSSSREVYCWGSNMRGQLGDPAFVGAESTAPVRVSGMINDATALAAGEAHACVLRSDDSVWCWGDNTADQLSDPMIFDDYTATPQRISGVGGDVNGVGLSAAGNWTVAHQSAGHGIGFGDVPNFDAMGGVGANIAIPTPQFMNPTPPATETIAGPSAWCRLEADGVACWGDGPWMQNPIRLGGDELASYENGGTSYGIFVKQLDDPVSVAIGTDHMCAVNIETVICWGYNDRGQLGNGTTDAASWPVYVRSPGF